jgi:hypothetical protein
LGECGGGEDGVVGVLAVVVVEGGIVWRLVLGAGGEEGVVVVDEGVDGGADCFEGFFQTDIRVDEGKPGNVEEGVLA